MQKFFSASKNLIVPYVSTKKLKEPKILISMIAFLGFWILIKIFLLLVIV